MHFSLPLIIAAAASLCTAAPVTSTDNPVLEKRMDISDIHPFFSGETMNYDQMDKGINIWCSDMKGQVVPLGKSLNAQVSGLILRSGGPGVLAAHYTNNNIRSGWVIDEGECNAWMMKVTREVAKARSYADYSQGGYGMVGDLGSIWVDPNAQ